MTAPQPATPGSDSVRAQIAGEDWEATVDGWKAEIEAMSLAELLASFGTDDPEEETHRGE